MNKQQTIFVQIASYRDPQLVPTIEDMLRTASHPDMLRIGLCHQFHPLDEFTTDLDPYRKDARFRIIDVPFDETKGVCWARNEVQQLYEGEDFTLQIDSHMRFAKGWDEQLIGMHTQLIQAGISKPLLTAYVPSFDPANDPASRKQEPWRMNFDRFIPEGAVFFIPETIPDWQEVQMPIPSRFYSAHMAFAAGEFSIEVQHNPDYYFHGEEISITVRAFTHGYDLFHPHRAIIWHEYTRKGRAKQWDDDQQWATKNHQSHLTNRKLFGMDGEKQQGHEGKYGFGSVRTLEEYEQYAGISFRKRGVQQYTINKLPPPNPGPMAFGSQKAWEDSFLPIFKHCIDIDPTLVPEPDYDFWAVAFHAQNQDTIFRQDADKDEIQRMMADPDGYCKVWREFQTEVKPDYWVVWPHSIKKGWCDRLTGKL